MSDKWASRVMGSIAIFAALAALFGFAVAILGIVVAVRHG